MTLDRSAWLATKPATAADVRSKPTHRLDIQSVARLVHEAHLDSLHQDASSSFDTLDSCERILRQIILDNVCGPFDSLGSRRVEVNGQTLAVSLLTWPLQGVAHISEVATAPSHRGLGLARHCLRETMASAFERAGARCATLSVTASNRAALTLYESMGFVASLRYQSHVLRRTGR
jgi:ribosomal protein S18 acetylase RimI-like enzyme